MKSQAAPVWILAILAGFFGILMVVCAFFLKNESAVIITTLATLASGALSSLYTLLRQEAGLPEVKAQSGADSISIAPPKSTS
jgi:drug/metabolite transporter (DMT)-like permease